MSQSHQTPVYRGRRVLVLACLAIAFATLVGRAVDLQVLNKDFLQDQGDARYLRVVTIPAHRGMITDRNGEPLAISTPVDSVWANPQEFVDVRAYVAPLAKVLDLPADQLQRTLAAGASREFVYLKRHISPSVAQQVREMKVPGVYLRREYGRYYPSGPVTAHVLGFTNIDDVGQEGLELAFNDWLRGEPGAKRVIKDGHQHIIQDVELIRAPRPGRDLTLSIDRRIQYLAYRELKAAVMAHKAHSGSVVVMDATTDEVLAMVNVPSYNPNNRSNLRPAAMRNRAVTDVFEPGSTIKPFTIACALESGRYTPTTPIDTAPGFYKIGLNTVRDDHDYGMLDVTGVIQKSSNVGASRIALSMPSKTFWDMLHSVGLGSITASGFPGESPGLLPDYQRWSDFVHATLAFGYGLSVTPLQLAHAYTAIADNGVIHPVTFLRLNQPPAGRRVMPVQVARELRTIMESVVTPEGTGYNARVAGYHVAGKTGTVHKAVDGGYARRHYDAIFAGMAPATNPRLVIVVMVNDPTVGGYYGGLVAAPVFSKVMAGSLRLLDIPPDDLPLLESRHGSPGGPA